jgi:phosphoribulokinase
MHILNLRLILWLICFQQVSVVEMDGQFDNLQELIYVESHLSNIGTKFYGELTQNILKLSDSPGSNNGTGFLQTLIALKLREIYEKITNKKVEPAQVGASAAQPAQ